MEKKTKEIKSFFVDTKGVLSYTNYSFSLYLFVERLYNELIKEGIRSVFFLSREGEYLKKLFDAYCGKNEVKNNIDSKYLYVSRQSTFAASLKDTLDREDFSRLFFQYNNMSINAFLKNIGISENNRMLLQNELAYDFEDTIEDFRNSNEYLQLIALPLFSKLFYETVKTAKAGLLRYLNEQGFFADDKVALVDVGWKGSIQDNISRASAERNTIKGYYLGLVGDVVTNAYNQKKGLIFADYPIKTDFFEIWNFDSHFYERLLTASHPSTKGYAQADGKMVPIFNEHGKEKKNYELIKPLQDAIFYQYKKLIEFWGEEGWSEEEKLKLVLRYHILAMTRVTAENMRFQLTLLKGQEENFGQQTSNENLITNHYSGTNIVKRIRKKYKSLKDPVIIARVLSYKGMFSLSAAIIRLSGKKMLKRLEQS